LFADEQGVKGTAAGKVDAVSADLLVSDKPERKISFRIPSESLDLLFPRLF